jgi:hypothetical protein
MFKKLQKLNIYFRMAIEEFNSSDVGRSYRLKMREVIISSLLFKVPSISNCSAQRRIKNNVSENRHLFLKADRELFFNLWLMRVHWHVILQLRYVHVVQILQLDNHEILSLSLLNVTAQYKYYRAEKMSVNGV